MVLGFIGLSYFVLFSGRGAHVELEVIFLLTLLQSFLLILVGRDIADERIGLKAEQIWEYLSDCSKWESYYNNVSDITPPESGPKLKKGDVFKFSTFGKFLILLMDFFFLWVWG